LAFIKIDQPAGLGQGEGEILHPFCSIFEQSLNFGRFLDFPVAASENCFPNLRADDRLNSELNNGVLKLAPITAVVE
jgi:hypothetical protein